VRRQGVYGVDIVPVDVEDLIARRRERRAVDLFTELNDANAENDIARRDDTLDRLRSLARNHPNDEAVRQQLGMGLLNTMNDARTKGNLVLRNALLDELGALARNHPDDAVLGGQRDMGTFNALVGTGAGLSDWKALKLWDEFRGRRGFGPPIGRAGDKLWYPWRIVTGIVSPEMS
jgi:hypothetical protein